MPLVNGEFELRGFQFGTNRSGYPIVPGGFEVNPTNFRTQDQDNPLGGGVTFGVDKAGHVTFTWQLLILREGENKWSEAHKAVENIRRIWRSSTVHNKPSETLELTWYHGDQPLISYGRPRHFAVDRTKLRQGVAVVTCDFTSEDDLAYGAEEHFASLGYLPPSTGGLTAPLIAPLTAYGTGAQREGFIVVSGEAPTPVRIRIYGPVTNPWVQLVNHWTVGVTMNIPDTEYVDIDARLNSVMLNGDKSVAGKLTRVSPQLSALTIPEGSHELVYGGQDPTSTSRAEIYWREAQYAI